MNNLNQLEGHTLKAPIDDIKKLAEGNQHIIESIIEDCYKRKINVFFVTTPCHKYYRENIDTTQYTIMQSTIQNLLSRYPKIQYLDYFSDLDFIDDDYDNNNHLSIEGAEKLSKKIHTLLKKEHERYSYPIRQCRETI